MQGQLSFSDPRLLGAIAARVTESCIASDFSGSLVAAFAELIPGCIVSLDEIHAPSGTYHLSHTLPVTESSVTRAVERLKQVYMQSPIHRYMDGPGQETILDLRELAPTRALHRTDFYQEVLQPLSIQHQIAVRLDRPGWSCTLTLNRDTAFEPDLKRFLRHLSPTLIAAHRVACQVRELRLASATHRPETLPLLKPLTPREWEVLTWMREGKRNTEIALILACSVRTVEKHVENILRKTGTETRSAAIRLLPS